MKSDSKRGRDYEKQIARMLCGSVVPASGAGPIHKGDVIVNGFLLDCKHTEKSQYILKRDEIAKMREHAQNTGRREGYVIGFGEAHYALVPIDCFKEYLDFVMHGGH